MKDLRLVEDYTKCELRGEGSPAFKWRTTPSVGGEVKDLRLLSGGLHQV